MIEEIIIEPGTEREEHLFFDVEEIIDNGDGTLTLKILSDVKSWEDVYGSQGTC